MTNEELLAEIDALRSLMAAVATGGPKIDDVSKQYGERRRRVARGLSDRGIEDPNPYSDLWEWYGKWSSDFPKWQQRREHLTALFRPAVEALKQKATARVSAVSEEPTGWERVDRAVDKARHQLERSEDEEDFQQVGLLCREILISLAQAVYDPAKHETADGVTPSKTDAKRLLEACLLTELEGRSNQAVRKHARASLDLANDLQHRRSAEYRYAALCLEATLSVVNIFAILLEKRGHQAPSPIPGDAEQVARLLVIERLGSLTNEQRMALEGSFKAVSDDSGSLIFAWTVVGGGLDPLESYLTFLLDEEAIVRVREEKPSEREVRRWYRFKPWLVEYLSQNPEVFEEDNFLTAT